MLKTNERPHAFENIYINYILALEYEFLQCIPYTLSQLFLFKFFELGSTAYHVRYSM